MIYSKISIEEIKQVAKRVHWKCIEEDGKLKLSRKYKDELVELELVPTEEGYEVI